MSNLQAIQGVGTVTAAKLEQAGYTSYARIASAALAELSEDVGISFTIAERIIKSARTLLETEQSEELASGFEDEAPDGAESDVYEADVDEPSEIESVEADDTPGLMEVSDTEAYEDTAAFRVREALVEALSEGEPVETDDAPDSDSVEVISETELDTPEEFGQAETGTTEAVEEVVIAPETMTDAMPESPEETSEPAAVEVIDEPSEAVEEAAIELETAEDAMPEPPEETSEPAAVEVIDEPPEAVEEAAIALEKAEDAMPEPPEETLEPAAVEVIDEPPEAVEEVAIELETVEEAMPQLHEETLEPAAVEAIDEPSEAVEEVAIELETVEEAMPEPPEETLELAVVETIDEPSVAVSEAVIAPETVEETIPEPPAEVPELTDDGGAETSTQAEATARDDEPEEAEPVVVAVDERQLMNELVEAILLNPNAVGQIAQEVSSELAQILGKKLHKQLSRKVLSQKKFRKALISGLVKELKKM